MCRMNQSWVERAYGVAGLALALVIGLISADLLLGGAISAALGRPPVPLAVVPSGGESGRDGGAGAA
jgi:hypothetical protein